MTVFMARNTDAAVERIFPPITPDLYAPDTSAAKLNADQAAARRLLASSVQLTARAQYFPGRHNTRERFSRLLLIHHRAFDFEREGQFTQADYFWEELHTQFVALCKNELVWYSLAESLAAEQPQLLVLNDASKLENSFVEELLIDTHAAFFNGYAESAGGLTVDSRAWNHLDYVKALLDSSGLSDKQKFRLIKVATRARIELYEKAKRWTEVAALCTSMLRYNPDAVYYEDRLSNANLDQRIAHYLNAAHPGGHEADQLAAAIADLERLQSIYPFDATLYKKLNAAHEVSRGLVYAQKALTIDPSDSKSRDLLRELTASMNELKDRAKTTSGPPGPQIGESGPFLFDEVRTGFSLLEAYRDSDEARKLAEAARLAKAVNLWRRIGLPKPADRWTNRSLALQQAIDSIVVRRPPTVEAIEQAWQQSSETDEDLRQLDCDRVCRYLKQRLLKHGPPARDITDQSSAFVLKTASTPALKQAGPPFAFWLFSRRDLPAKIRAAAVIVLFLLASVAFVKDMYARSVRTASYQSILKASDQRNYLEVIEGAEAFLSHPLIASTDDRDAKVIEQYRKALVLWVARQPGAITPQATAHIQRYQQLVGNRNGGGL